MTTHEDERLELIEHLLTALINDPRKMTLEARVLPRRVNWRVKVDINDTGKLIGRQACHLKALRAIVFSLGARYGEDWRLDVDDPDDAERLPITRTPDAEAYDVAPALTLLREVLAALLQEVPYVEVQGAGSSFNLKISAVLVQDYEALATPVPVERDPRRPFEQMTPIAALGTLWRAIGRQGGASLTVEVPAR